VTAGLGKSTSLWEGSKGGDQKKARCTQGSLRTGRAYGPVGPQGGESRIGSVTGLSASSKKGTGVEEKKDSISGEY